MAKICKSQEDFLRELEAKIRANAIARGLEGAALNQFVASALADHKKTFDPPPNS